jgi:hypothetical protein
MLKTKSDFEIVSFCALYERKRRSKSLFQDKKAAFCKSIHLQEKWTSQKCFSFQNKKQKTDLTSVWTKIPQTNSKKRHIFDENAVFW